MAVYRSAAQMIGETPLLLAEKFKAASDIKAHILAKMEYLNPTGSVKDRVAKEIIEDAEKRGILLPGGVIIEPTSGNTGIGLASLAAAKGYKAVIVMPDSMSIERRNLIKAYGADIVLTPAAAGMQGAIEKAEQLKKEIPGAIIAGQFVNPSNPAAHRKTTGPEIWRDTQGAVDIFIAGVGTGGTLSGTGAYLREKKKDIQIIAVEPETSPVLSQGHGGAHGIQGIGAGFVPETLDTAIYDAVVTVSDADALAYAKRFAASEGLLVGISSGAALCAAAKIGAREENKDKRIVVILPDSADRYYSTPLFG
ncbi:MAG: cysteine synthase A [Clostridia bacterium]|nr:cysteine synthase A [Clostridia bacterium]